jgi:AraC-like DNA-binding protein
LAFAALRRKMSGMARRSGPELSFTMPDLARVATYPPGATFGPRAMHDYEFVWLIEGDALYSWNDQVVEAPEGAVVLCRPRGTDCFQWDKQRRTRHAFFHFQISRTPRAWPAAREWPLARAPSEGDVLRPMFRYLLTWLGRGGDAALCRLSVEYMLRAFVLGQFQTHELPSEALPEPVDRAMAYIRKVLEDDPSSAIAFEDLVDAACVTGPHLCRLFKKTTGRTPAETVRLARLDRAAGLVARSNYSVKQIADICGFATPFHFSRLFKGAYGVSPAKLRGLIEAGQTPPVPKLSRTWRLGM